MRAFLIVASGSSDEFIAVNGLEQFVENRLVSFPDKCIVSFDDFEDMADLEGEYSVDFGDFYETPDAEYAISVGKDYPIKPPLWHLDSICSRGKKTRSGALKTTRDGSGVDIYVVDTKTNLSHPEFSGRHVTVNDGVSPSDAWWYTPPTNSSGNATFEETEPLPFMHGCAVAMIAGGDTLGLASGSKILAVPADVDNYFSSLDLAVAFDSVIQRHRHQNPPRNAVINLSIGAPLTSTFPVMLAPGSVTSSGNTTRELLLSVQKIDKIVVVTSAGNGGHSAFHQFAEGADYSGKSAPHRAAAARKYWVEADEGTPFFNVTSLDVNDAISQYACYGEVMLCAPGVDIYIPRCDLEAEQDAVSWFKINGTSFASPLVAGLLALYLQDKPAPTYNGGAAMLVDSTCEPSSLATFLTSNATAGEVSGIGEYEATHDVFRAYPGGLHVQHGAASGYSIGDKYFARARVNAAGNLTYIENFRITDVVDHTIPLKVYKYTDFTLLDTFVVPDWVYFYYSGYGWWYLCQTYDGVSGLSEVPYVEDSQGVTTPNLMAFNPYIESVDKPFNTVGGLPNLLFDLNIFKLRLYAGAVSHSGFMMSQGTLEVVSGTLPPGISLGSDAESLYVEKTAGAPLSALSVVTLKATVDSVTYTEDFNIRVDDSIKTGMIIRDSDGVSLYDTDSLAASMLHSETLTGSGSHTIVLPLENFPEDLVIGNLKVFVNPLEHSDVADNPGAVQVQRNFMPSVYFEGDSLKIQVYVSMSWNLPDQSSCTSSWSSDTLASIESTSKYNVELWYVNQSKIFYSGDSSSWR